MDDNSQLTLFEGKKKPQLPKIEKESGNTEIISRFNSLEETKEEALKCQKCVLCKTRNNVVFSKGSPQAKVMIIGEGPGQHEDESGIPFVGRAGKLLDKILESQEIDKEKDVYICNIVKCRPPKNRVPTPEEMEACWEYLEAQIKFMAPKIILLTGSTAVRKILKVKLGITKIRGNWYEDIYGARAMPIYHPSYLLRNPSNEKGKPKWQMWQDIKEIRRYMDELDSQ